MNRDVTALLEDIRASLEEAYKIVIKGSGNGFDSVSASDPQVYDSTILLSTNSKRVMAAAQEALQMLAKDPNKVAGMKESEVEQFVQDHVNKVLKKETRIKWNTKSYPD